MRKTCVFIFLVFIFLNISGCVPLVVGGAAGVVGGYAVSQDTIQGETDKPYDMLWMSANTVIRIRGTIKMDNVSQGTLEAVIEGSRVWIKLAHVTDATTRLSVSARKHGFPNLKLAQDLFTKIMEEAR